MDLKLYDYQKKHVENVSAWLEKSYFALENSALGSGKTYTSSKILLQTGIKHCVVISPLSLMTKWNHVKKTYNLPIQHIITFSSLAGKSSSKLSHPLLIREDYTDDKDVKHTDFKPSDALLNMIKNGGLMLIVDEAQNIKNKSSYSSNAVAAIVKAIKDDETKRSKLLLLSASLFDRKEHAITFFKTIGVLTEKRLLVTNPYTKVTTWTGLNQIYQFCASLDNDAAYHIKYTVMRFSKPESIVFDFFVKIILPRCKFNMAVPDKIESSPILSCNNYMATITDKEEFDTVRAAVSELSSSAKFNKIDNTVNLAPTGNGVSVMSMITKALMRIETAKIPTFVRLAKQILVDYPKSKLTIAVNYNETLNALEKQLEEYNPSIMKGSTSIVNRGLIQERYHDENHPSRLIIGNLQVLNCGIDLDEKCNTNPVFALASANYSSMNLYQYTGRFMRASSKANAFAYFVYIDGATETNILDALGRKSGIMNYVTGRDNQDLKLPGEFNTLFEKDNIPFGTIPVNSNL